MITELRHVRGQPVKVSFLVCKIDWVASSERIVPAWVFCTVSRAPQLWARSAALYLSTIMSTGPDSLSTQSCHGTWHAPPRACSAMARSCHLKSWLGVNETHAVGTCRYVLEMPANLATPTMLANTAESIAASSGGTVSAKILEQEECEKMGMGLYLGVSACSAEPPKFIHLTYSPKGMLLRLSRQLHLSLCGSTCFNLFSPEAHDSHAWVITCTVHRLKMEYLSLSLQGCASETAQTAL